MFLLRDVVTAHNIPAARLLFGKLQFGEEIIRELSSKPAYERQSMNVD